MERNFLIAAYPQPNLNIKESLGISIFTNIQLIDYCLNTTSTQSSSLIDLSNSLSNHAKEDLQILRTVFAHGVILRDYFIKHAQDLSQDWDSFIRWWKQLDDEQVIALIIYGVKESMDYYYKNLPSMPTVERTMTQVSLETEQLHLKSNREKAIKAVLQSWSVENIDQILPLYNDIAGIKKRIINLLKEVWTSGFNVTWKSKKKRIVEWLSMSTSLLTKSYGTNEEAIYTVTGLYPDTNEIEKINRAKSLTFVPVSHMGRMITYYELNNHIYLMFEPSLPEQHEIHSAELKTNDYYSAFEGLGDATRLQILNLLSEFNEMYAQQIVNELNMKQSTVSRHLNQLHQSNLVTVRQDGNTKYFSINKDEIIKVINVLELFTK